MVVVDAVDFLIPEPLGSGRNHLGLRNYLKIWTTNALDRVSQLTIRMVSPKASGGTAWRNKRPFGSTICPAPPRGVGNASEPIILMGEAFRSWVDRIPGNQAGVAGVCSQVVRQAVRNMSQVGQGQRVSPVVACYGYFQGIDTVNAPCAACGAPGALVNHHPGRGRGRSTPPPRLTRGWRRAGG